VNLLPGLEVGAIMLKSNRHRLSRSASFALAAACACFLLPIVVTSEAADVYFPATQAYNRHNYDPFDQASEAHATSIDATTAAYVAERGDVQLSSEIRLVGGERFEQMTAPPANMAAQANQVVPAALRVSSPPVAEMLPTPPSAAKRLTQVEEPGADWAPTPLADLTTNTVLPAGTLPRDYWNERTPQHVAFFDPTGTTRGWPVNTFNWVASCFCCNPLYFEEVNLERYGYGCGCFGPCCTQCVQSTVSGAHFFANVVALPYKMGVDCPCECDYTLGHYRPGSCPPWRYTCCTRCKATGGLTAGGVAMGLIFLIP
jgi:hypothetical protein